MPWQLVFVSFYIFRTSAYLLQRIYARDTALPPSVPPALAKLLAVTPLGMIVGLYVPHHIHWSWWLMVLLLIESVGIGIYSKLGFIASHGLSVGEFQIVNQLFILVVIALGWLLLGEKLTVTQLVAAALLLSSAILAARAPKDADTGKRSRHHLRLLLLAVVGTAAFGVGLIGERAALHHMDLGAYFIFGFSAQTLSSLLIALPDMKAARRMLTKHDIILAFWWGSVVTLGGFVYLYAVVRSKNISLIVALTAFVLPLTVVAAYIWLKERENIKTLAIAVTLGCLGLVISAL